MATLDGRIEIIATSRNGEDKDTPVRIAISRGGWRGRLKLTVEGKGYTVSGYDLERAIHVANMAWSS